jgi:hypothetical protein
MNKRFLVYDQDGGRLAINRRFKRWRLAASAPYLRLDGAFPAKQCADMFDADTSPLRLSILVLPRFLKLSSRSMNAP